MNKLEEAQAALKFIKSLPIKELAKLKEKVEGRIDTLEKEEREKDLVDCPFDIAQKYKLKPRYQQAHKKYDEVIDAIEKYHPDIFDNDYLEDDDDTIKINGEDVGLNWLSQFGYTSELTDILDWEGVDYDDMNQNDVDQVTALLKKRFIKTN